MHGNQQICHYVLSLLSQRMFVWLRCCRNISQFTLNECPKYWVTWLLIKSTENFTVRKHAESCFSVSAYLQKQITNISFYHCFTEVNSDIWYIAVKVGWELLWWQENETDSKYTLKKVVGSTTFVVIKLCWTEQWEAVRDLLISVFHKLLVSI